MKSLTDSHVPGHSSNITCLEKSSPEPPVPTCLIWPIMFVICSALTAGACLLFSVCPSPAGRSVTMVFPVSGTVSGNKINVS